MATAAELARVYDAYVSALWRGDPDVAPLGTWLSAYWYTGPAPVRTAPPAAISPCGGGGRGIGWHDTPTAVLGCVPGAGGCYLVPSDAVPPTLGPPRTDILLGLRHGDGPLVVATGSPLTRESSEAVAASGPTRGDAAPDPCG